jgi:hypothetical protein
MHAVQFFSKRTKGGKQAVREKEQDVDAEAEREAGVRE